MTLHAEGGGVQVILPPLCVWCSPANTGIHSMDTPPVKGFKGHYKFLSNFFPVALVWDGIHYPTVEHAYQAQKTLDPRIRVLLALQPTPDIVKREGKAYDKARPEWAQIKLQVMEDLVREKFKNPMLELLLISTGDAHLEETNKWGDTFWGVCGGIGENHLGKILMKVREEIQCRRKTLPIDSTSPQSPSS